MTPRRKKFATIGQEIDDVIKRYYAMWRDHHQNPQLRKNAPYVQFWCHRESALMSDAIVEIIDRERRKAVEEAFNRYGADDLNSVIIEDILNSMFPQEK